MAEDLTLWADRARAAQQAVNDLGAGPPDMSTEEGRRAYSARNMVMPGLRVGGYLTLQQRFEEWLESPDGQEVSADVTKRAIDLWRRGFSHYGIAALWEAARYSRDLRVGPNAGFKLNNDFRSRLARRIMAEVPELDGFFEVRELKA